MRDVSKVRESMRCFCKQTLRSMPCVVTGLSVLTVMPLTAATCQLRTVTIDDGEQHLIVHTLSTSVDDILADAGVTITEEDTVSSTVDGMEQTIEIQRAFEVRITVDETDVKTVHMTEGTVADALGLADVSTELYRPTNMEETQQLTSDTEIVVEAVPKNEFLDENGTPCMYEKVLNGVACAYTTPAGNRGITSTGTVPAVGTVAVNPKVIPYGTKLYIVSEDGYVYGYGVASDTGGDLLNGKIMADLYMDTYNDCIQFGRRKVNIYILPCEKDR